MLILRTHGHTKMFHENRGKGNGALLNTNKTIAILIDMVISQEISLCFLLKISSKVPKPCNVKYRRVCTKS